ncbi:hypothetical protein TNCV_3271171 [Trichonephila clavipes]|nr:hypothetical protein TNCV_3271171 [Trichonephila clavipes]
MHVKSVESSLAWCGSLEKGMPSNRCRPRHLTMVQVGRYNEYLATSTGVSRQADHITGTSAHAPQGLKPHVLSWTQQTLALTGCNATEF